MIARSLWPIAALVFASTGLGTTGVRAADPSAAALMDEHKCYSCHADDHEVAGPAYVDVAAKYRGNPNAIAIVAARVREGVRGGGPWHMPPHPEISPEDARTIARYILSLDRRRDRS